MLCRALLTITAISYLICVLILSGLQKEDLDVNMLQKLERHGLDIEDINNESLREDCLRSAKTTDKDERLNTEDLIIISTTPENVIRTEIKRQQGESNDKDRNKTDLKAVVKYFMDLQKSEDKTKTINVSETTINNNVFDNYHIPQSSNLKYIFSDMIGYNLPQFDKNRLPSSTTDGNFHLFSQNIFKLWNTYRKQDLRGLTTEQTTLQTTNSNIINNMNGPEIALVKQIIADYISKNQIIPTTNVPQKKELDIARITDEIRRLLDNTQSAVQNKLRNSEKSTEYTITKSQSDVYANKTAHDFYNNLKKESDMFLDPRPTPENKNVFRELLKNESEIPIKDMINLDEQKGINNPLTKFYMPINKEKPYENKPNDNNFKDYNLIKDGSIFNTVNNLYANMEKKNHPQSTGKPLPNDFIKEIAESVKAMVLNDLKKDISTIMTSTITTEITSTIKNGEEKVIEATHMMEKFMELFQQFKTIKEKTIITGNSQVKVTEKKDVKHEYKGPVQVIYSSNKPDINPYAIRSPAEQFAPIFVKQYNDPSVKAPKYIALPNIQNPVYQVRQVDKFNVKTGLRLTPITIQTNSFEVPPLGIPIEKPLNMLNQNIIVTTESPNLRPRLDTHHTNYIRHIDRYNIEDDFRNRNSWQKPVSNPKREYKPYVRDDAYTLHDNVNFKIKKSDRSRFDERNDRDYKPHFTKSDYDRMKLRNKEIKRFHERLENTDESKNTEEKEDCCKVLVASRQQLPLANAKKRSRYDDVHFRNFLKTQQKVNDMLEKILATKTKSDGPRTVETT